MNNVVVGHRALESEGCEQSGNNEGEGVSVTGRLGNRNLQFSILASDLGYIGHAAPSVL
jgi:hypothetical protein